MTNFPDEPIVETGHVIDLIISGIDNEIENLRDDTLVNDKVVDGTALDHAVMLLREAKRALLAGKEVKCQTVKILAVS